MKHALKTWKSRFFSCFKSWFVPLFFLFFFMISHFKVIFLSTAFLFKHSAYLESLPVENRCEIMVYSLMQKAQSSRCVTNTMQNGRKIETEKVVTNHNYYPARKVKGDEYVSDDLPKFYRRWLQQIRNLLKKKSKNPFSNIFVLFSTLTFQNIMTNISIIDRFSPFPHRPWKHHRINNFPVQAPFSRCNWNCLLGREKLEIRLEQTSQHGNCLQHRETSGFQIWECRRDRCQPVIF